MSNVVMSYQYRIDIGNHRYRHSRFPINFRHRSDFGSLYGIHVCTYSSNKHTKNRARTWLLAIVADRFWYDSLCVCNYMYYMYNMYIFLIEEVSGMNVRIELACPYISQRFFTKLSGKIYISGFLLSMNFIGYGRPVSWASNI